MLELRRKFSSEIVMKNLLKELLRTKRSVSSVLFTLEQLYNRFIFGVIYVNN